MKRSLLITANILLTVVLLSLSSCEKDRLTLLTDGIWSFSNLTTDSDDDVAKATIATYKAIHTDATLQFFDDGSYEKDAPLFENPESGEWQLFGENQLVFTIGDAGYTASIDLVKKDELVYIETYIDGMGNPYAAKFKWVK